MARRFGFQFARLIAEFENKRDGSIVTKAYRDSGGEMTGPAGIIEVDGVAVYEGQTWTLDEAVEIYADARADFAAAIEAMLPGPVNNFQFDALGALAWNIGISGLRNSTVMKMLEANRFEDAAAAFLMWTGDTLRGGEMGPDGKPARNPEGQVMQVGEKWFKVFRGIYRRSASAALLFMGYDWVNAAAPSRIRVRTETVLRKPGYYYDQVKDATPWHEILSDARHDKLPDPQPDPALFDDTDPTISKRGAQPQGETMTPPAWNELTDAQKTAYLNDDQAAQLKTVSETVQRTKPEGPAPARPRKPIALEDVEYGIHDPADVGFKPMRETGRYRGRRNVDAGKVLAIGGTATAGMSAMAGNIKDINTAFSSISPVTLLIVLISGAIVTGLFLVWHGKNKEYISQKRADKAMV